MDKCHYKIVKRVPSAEEYQNLRKSLDCETVSDEAVERGLAHSLFSVCAMQDDVVVGCGRVVGDGGIYFFIQDLMVLPAHEGEGIDDCLMDEIMLYLKKAAPPNAIFCIKGCSLQRGRCSQFGFKRDEDVS